ncbi:MAG: carboxypeptidase regulatory-like domain-containing protein [Elusimicrobiota bacterium]
MIKRWKDGKMARWLGRFAVLLITLLLYQLIPCLYASFGKSGWTIFRKVSSAKFKCMTTIVAVRGDLSGVFYNPAVLGTNTQREIFFLSELGFTEDKLGGLVYGEPLSNGMLAGGVAYYDAGKMELNWLEGDELKTENVIAQQDILGLVSYGHKLTEQMFLGATVKIATSRIAERKSSVAYCGDLGAFYLPVENLSVSVSAQNLGSSTKFIEKKNPLPTSAYLGSGYSYLLSPISYLLPGLGITYNFSDEEIIPEAGFELGYNIVSLNVGYRFNVKEANLHFGLGLNWKNIDFGYAFIPGMYLDTTHRVSIGYRFGEAHGTDAEMERRTDAEQKQTNYISVEVTDTAGNPLSYTTIKISQDEQIIVKELTDINGQMSINDLPSGTYTVKAWKQGYIAEEKEVAISSHHPAEVHFILKKK